MSAKRERRFVTAGGTLPNADEAVPSAPPAAPAPTPSPSTSSDVRMPYTWRLDASQAMRLDQLVLRLRSELGAWRRSGQQGRGPVNRADVLDALVRAAESDQAVFAAALERVRQL